MLNNEIMARARPERRRQPVDDSVLGSRRVVVGLTVVLSVLFVASAWWEGELDEGNPYLSALLILLNTAPLLAVRWNPLVVALTFGVAYPLWLAQFVDGVERQGHVLQSLPTLVALYAVGSWSRPLWLRAVALVVPAWMMGAALSGLWRTDVLDLSYVALVFVVVWALGVAMATRRAYEAELEATAAELRSTQKALAERMIVDERARIARELHDVIAHAMSVITVQAGVAHHLGSGPAQAGAALSVIERTGREALSELRRMLMVLRDPNPGNPLTEPRPGLADLPALVATAADAGVTVTTVTDGAPRQLPPGLDLAVYRVVQEALTNVAKHSPGVRANVTLRFRPDRLTVEVHDRGGHRGAAFTAGQGLRGMAERVALYDGELDTAAEPEGFHVTARFPLSADSASLP